MEVFPKFGEALNAFEHFYNPPPRLIFGHQPFHVLDNNNGVMRFPVILLGTFGSDFWSMLNLQVTVLFIHH
jgi:hypothetical protein